MAEPLVWRVNKDENDCGWVHVEPEKYTGNCEVKIWVDPAKTTTDRTACTIEFVATVGDEERKKTLTVHRCGVQCGCSAYPFTRYDNITIPSGGGQGILLGEIEPQNNCPMDDDTFTIEANVSWVTVYEDNGTVKVDVDPNDGQSSRSFKLIFKYEGEPCDHITNDKLTFSQQGKGCSCANIVQIFTGNTTVTIGSDESSGVLSDGDSGTFKFECTNDNRPTVSVSSDVDWLTVSADTTPTREGDIYTISYTASTNTFDGEREGNINIKVGNDECDEWLLFTIEQGVEPCGENCEIDIVKLFDDDKLVDLTGANEQELWKVILKDKCVPLDAENNVEFISCGPDDLKLKTYVEPFSEGGEEGFILYADFKNISDREYNYDTAYRCSCDLTMKNIVKEHDRGRNGYALVNNFSLKVKNKNDEDCYTTSLERLQDVIIESKVDCDKMKLKIKGFEGDTLSCEGGTIDFEVTYDE